ncbi:unnamed protein product [Tetraodon nigroviridis]|uniref:(spotted green pufferfish) hypothetical protein n=1 Tax=Tetraodon nigroviridis TaxID=99883 RepID=Q4RWI0_TETNG|nr:unnamed protein product [Tetraodon nigroviridis]
MEEPVLEPGADRMARYKAESRRDLAQRYGHVEELPNRRGFQDSDGSTAAPPGPEAPQLHTRVSVGQLRSALLQQHTPSATQAQHVYAHLHVRGPRQPVYLCADAGRAAPSPDPPIRRRPRRYLPSGSGRSGERFRTQPVTAEEVEESSGQMEAEEEENCKADVKTDSRAKMSVAAKMSLFKELEKSAAPEAPAHLKRRPGGVSQERRARRGNDARFLTQPITCEEMVAISPPRPLESQPAPAQPAEDHDESCKLSMSEKLALFNKLALAEKQSGGPAHGPPERRRQKGARYHTQPITVEEVSLLADRQQDSSVNLKPSELRLSQRRSDPPADVTQHRASEPALRGILKKGCSGAAEGSGTDAGQRDAASSLGQNGGGCEEERMEQHPVLPVPPRRQRRPAPAGEGGSARGGRGLGPGGKPSPAHL